MICNNSIIRLIFTFSNIKIWIFDKLCYPIGKDYCTRETKIRPTEKFVKNLCKDKFRVAALIGYTHNEVENGG